MMSAVSPEQLKGGLKVVLAVSETIRAAGRIPSGVLYAALMGRVTLDAYQRILGVLERGGLIEIRSHEIIWTGPEVLSK